VKPEVALGSSVPSKIGGLYLRIVRSEDRSPS
jgi:hypothetical protein